MLQQQGRVTEIADPQQRIAAIAKSYAAHPENTIIVSPDNASRRAINQAVRQELQALGVAGQGGSFHARAHAALRYDRRRSGVGQRAIRPEMFCITSVAARSMASSAAAMPRSSRLNPKENLVTVQKAGRRTSHL